MNKNAINISLLGLSILGRLVTGVVLPDQHQSDMTAATTATETKETAPSDILGRLVKVVVLPDQNQSDITTATNATETKETAPSDISGRLVKGVVLPDQNQSDTTTATNATETKETAPSDISGRLVKGVVLPDQNQSDTTTATNATETKETAPSDGAPFSVFGGLNAFSKADAEGDSEANIAYDFSKSITPVDESKDNADFYTKSESDQQAPVPPGEAVPAQDLEDRVAPGTETADDSAAKADSLDQADHISDSDNMDDFDTFTEEYMKEFNVDEGDQGFRDEWSTGNPEEMPLDPASQYPSEEPAFDVMPTAEYEEQPPLEDVDPASQNPSEEPAFDVMPTAEYEEQPPLEDVDPASQYPSEEPAFDVMPTAEDVDTAFQYPSEEAETDEDSLEDENIEYIEQPIVEDGTLPEDDFDHVHLSSASHMMTSGFVLSTLAMLI